MRTAYFAPTLSRRSRRNWCLSRRIVTSELSQENKPRRMEEFSTDDNPKSDHTWRQESGQGTLKTVNLNIDVIIDWSFSGQTGSRQWCVRKYLNNDCFIRRGFTYCSIEMWCHGHLYVDTLFRLYSFSYCKLLLVSFTSETFKKCISAIQNISYRGIFTQNVESTYMVKSHSIFVFLIPQSRISLGKGKESLARSFGSNLRI